MDTVRCMNFGDNNYDLISRKQATDGIRRMAYVSTMLHETDVIMFLQSLPPVQRETGKWVKIHPLQLDDSGAYMCSNCKTGGWDIDPSRYKFCPYCGSYNNEVEEHD